MGRKIPEITPSEAWDSANVDTWRRELRAQVLENDSRITTTFRGLWDQVTDTLSAGAGGGALTAATNYQPGEYFVCSATGTALDSNGQKPELAGASLGAGDQVISDGTAWVTVAVSSDYLSSVIDDTAAGVITFDQPAVGSNPATANNQYMRKGESDAADAAHVAAPDPHGDRAYADAQDAAHAALTAGQDDVHGTKKYTDDAPRGIGSWLWTLGTGVVAGVGQIRMDSATYSSVTSIRVNIVNDHALGLGNFFSSLVSGDYLYIHGTDRALGGGLFSINADPTEPSANNVLFDVSAISGTGTASVDDQLYIHPLTLRSTTERSAGIGTWLYEGPSNVDPTADKSFSTDSTQWNTTTSIRIDTINDADVNTITPLLDMGADDFIYLRNARRKSGAVIYRLTETPTSVANGDVLMSNLTHVSSAGGPVVDEPYYFLPLYTVALTKQELQQHVAETLIHFDDVPIDGFAYNRQDRAWVRANEVFFGYLSDGGISGAWNTTLKTITGYSVSNSTSNMAPYLNPAAGYIEIPETGVWEIQATVVGDQGNNTKEEAMRLWAQYRDGPSGDIDFVLDVFDVATDKTSDRAFAFSYKRPLQVGDRIYLAVNATADMGTFSFEVTSLEVTRIL